MRDYKACQLCIYPYKHIVAHGVYRIPVVMCLMRRILVQSYERDIGRGLVQLHHVNALDRKGIVLWYVSTYLRYELGYIIQLFGPKIKKN